MKRFVLLATVFVMAACKDSPTEPAPQVPAAVAITTPQTIMVVGQTVPLTASVYDRDGKRITGAAVTWRSLTPTVASVSPSGVVTGISTGSATIEAEASGKAGSVTISVEPDPCTTPLSMAVGQVRMLSGPEAVTCIKLAPTTGPSDFLFITANADQAQDNTAVYSVLLSQVSAASIAAAQALVFDPRAYLEAQAIAQVDRAEERIRVQGQQLFRSVRPAVRESIRREANLAYSVSAAIAAEGDTVIDPRPGYQQPEPLHDRLQGHPGRR